MKTEREYLKNDIKHQEDIIEYLKMLDEKADVARRSRIIERMGTHIRIWESEAKLKELDFIEYCNTGRFPE
jgi:hypothetical protein